LTTRLNETLTIGNIAEVFQKIVGEKFDTYMIGRYYENGYKRPKLIDVKKRKDKLTNEFDTVKIVASE
jgi:hypothetical protein